jgi:hypothetical protein
VRTNGGGVDCCRSSPVASRENVADDSVRIVSGRVGSDIWHGDEGDAGGGNSLSELGEAAADCSCGVDAGELGSDTVPLVAVEAGGTDML